MTPIPHRHNTKPYFTRAWTFSPQICTSKLHDNLNVVSKFEVCTQSKGEISTLAAPMQMYCSGWNLESCQAIYFASSLSTHNFSVWRLQNQSRKKSSPILEVRHTEKKITEVDVYPIELLWIRKISHAPLCKNQLASAVSPTLYNYMVCTRSIEKFTWSNRVNKWRCMRNTLWTEKQLETQLRLEPVDALWLQEVVLSSLPLLIFS